MTILDKIIEHKKLEVAFAKKQISKAILEREVAQLSLKKVDIKAHFFKEHSIGLIAEFKRKSPSKGIINDAVDIKTVAEGYQNAGASAMSILTDNYFFGGQLTDLQQVASMDLDMLLLRKEFIIDEYQIFEAKRAGANLILLIAECLDKTQLKDYTQLAQSIGLNVLTELHDASEISKLYEQTDLLGINNRNLKTFDVSINRSIELLADLPDLPLKIAESGIDSPKIAAQLLQNGFHGLLIGEYFMKHKNPSDACAEFVKEIRKLVQ